jgi:glutamyl/glutaminyl-tRNA synthetase
MLRIEDHDRSRWRAEYDAALLDDLAWLGFEADIGPVRQADDETP